MARLVPLVALAALLAVPGSGAQAPQRGGTLVLGGYLEPACLGPRPDCDLGPLSAIVLEGAFKVKGGRWVPALVERVTPTDDPLTFDYHIQPEARWSDGTPVTTADFLFTHRVWRSVGLEHVDAGLWAGVRPLGRKSFRVTLASRSSSWRAYPTFVLPSHALEGEDPATVWRTRIDNPKTGAPMIGTGPFLVGRWERGKQITLVRNPRYWGPRTAYLDRVVVRFEQGTAAVEPFLRGEIDVFPAFPDDALPRLQGVPDIKVRVYPGTGREQLAIRVGPGGHPALRNKLVRRALAYGIDREAIARELRRSLAPGVKRLDNLLFLSQQPGYRANWSRYRYRPATARQLLEEAGCGRGSDGVYVCGGARLSLDVVTTVGNLRRQRALELIGRQLREVGVEIVPRYSPALFTQILPSGRFDIALFALTSDWPEDVPHSAYRCQGDANFTGYCSRLVTRDLAQLASIIDFARLAEVANDADRKLAVDVPAIPLFQSASRDAIRRRVRTPTPDSFPFHLNLEDWWLARGQ
jgi:peptide/nickel transport system substrate-binding protein